MEGSSALSEAELAGSLVRPGNRISFHLTLHKAFSFPLPLADGNDWFLSVARCAGRCLILDAKKARERKSILVLGRNNALIHSCNWGPSGSFSIFQKWEYCALCLRRFPPDLLCPNN